MLTSTDLSKLTGSAILATFLTGAMSLGTIASAEAAAIVAPSNLATVEGNGNNRFPFNFNMRYQQVFASTEFLSAGGEAQSITQIAFRPNGSPSGEAFLSLLSNIIINLSTTNTAPDALSTNFTDNVGGNEKTVYTGELLLSSASTNSPEGTKDFDIVINLQNPFIYTPIQGNLLLDVRNFAASNVTRLDSENTVSDSISRVFSFNPDAATGTADTTGLVTRFTTSPAPTSVPEPSTGRSLLTIGALTIVFLLKGKLTAA